MVPVRLVVIAGLLLAPAASRAEEPKRGEQVYQETCAACHATRFDKAPQLGDRKAWTPVIAKGQAVVTAHAWTGVRNMPPRGGNPELSLEAFSRAVAFMARTAGGEWKDPDAALLAKIRAQVQGHDHGKH